MERKTAASLERNKSIIYRPWPVLQHFHPPGKTILCSTGQILLNYLDFFFFFEECIQLFSERELRRTMKPCGRGTLLKRFQGT
jgi:hypothetical protein